RPDTVFTKRARPPVDPAARTTARSVRTPGLRVVVAVPVILAALAAGRLLWLSRGWPLVHDAPLMHYVAWRILEGAAPYRDVFDMNFPGVYLGPGLLQIPLGPGDGAFRAFDVGILLTAGAGLFTAARFGSAWGGGARAGLFVPFHSAG